MPKEVIKNLKAIRSLKLILSYLIQIKVKLVSSYVSIFFLIIFFPPESPLFFYN